MKLPSGDHWGARDTWSFTTGTGGPPAIGSLKMRPPPPASAPTAIHGPSRDQVGGSRTSRLGASARTFDPSASITLSVARSWLRTTTAIERPSRDTAGAEVSPPSDARHNAVARHRSDFHR